MTTGDRLCRAIEESGMSIRQVCQAAGIKRNTLRSLMRGDGNGYYDTWVRLSEAVGFSLDEMGGSDVFRNGRR